MQFLLYLHMCTCAYIQDMYNKNVHMCIYMYIVYQLFEGETFTIQWKMEQDVQSLRHLLVTFCTLHLMGYFSVGRLGSLTGAETEVQKWGCLLIFIKIHLVKCRCGYNYLVCTDRFCHRWMSICYNVIVCATIIRRITVFKTRLMAKSRASAAVTSL